MTDRTMSIMVALDDTYRVDDVEKIVNAIEMIKGVLKAEVCVKGVRDDLLKYSVAQQLKNEFMQKIIDL